MGVVRQITERKNADKELAKVYTLEKKARDEAEEANRTKDYFLAPVSHDFARRSMRFWVGRKFF